MESERWSISSTRPSKSKETGVKIEAEDLMAADGYGPDSADAEGAMKVDASSAAMAVLDVAIGDTTGRRHTRRTLHAADRRRGRPAGLDEFERWSEA
jgi:hypothetical protein